MADIVSPEVRSRMMGGIRGKDTKPELALRRAMHARGFRFRLHRSDLPSRPDLVFPRYRAVCFVHGCFWHRHPGCRYSTTPVTRPLFWQAKFDGNVERDIRNQRQLLASGWRVAIVWECALKRAVDATADLLAIWLVGNEPRADIGAHPDEKGILLRWEGVQDSAGSLPPEAHQISTKPPS